MGYGMNGTQYTVMSCLLSLPAIRPMTGETFRLQQDAPPAHRAPNTVDYLSQHAILLSSHSGLDRVCRPISVTGDYVEK